MIVDEDVGVWSAAQIKAHPDLTFDIFDSNKDGCISVPELTFRSRKGKRRGQHGMITFRIIDAAQPDSPRPHACLSRVST